MNYMPHAWAITAHNQRIVKMKRRLLRTYRRIAFKDHDCCWNCRFDIQSGDEYKAEVWAVTNPPWLPERKSVIEVRKIHIYCPDDPYEEEIQKEIREEASRPPNVNKAA